MRPRTAIEYRLGANGSWTLVHPTVRNLLRRGISIVDLTGGAIDDMSEDQRAQFLSKGVEFGEQVKNMEKKLEEWLQFIVPHKNTLPIRNDINQLLSKVQALDLDGIVANVFEVSVVDVKKSFDEFYMSVHDLQLELDEISSVAERLMSSEPELDADAEAETMESLSKRLRII